MNRRHLACIMDRRHLACIMDRRHLAYIMDRRHLACMRIWPLTYFYVIKFLEPKGGKEIVYAIPF